MGSTLIWSFETVYGSDPLGMEFLKYTGMRLKVWEVGTSC